ncbi:hypothetical protein BJP39_18710 [Streptomyces sp. CC77]|nr:hypothetical protein BJP39_18710 [Streptomyces sp. CC77]
MPPAVRVARLLVHVLFAATVLGGLGLFGSAVAADALGAGLLGTLLYGAAPGVAGWLLSRRVRSGGPGLWAGLLAVQVWLVLGALANIGDGYVHGFTELFLPVLVLWFLTRPESREWFRLPEREREGEPPFSLPHLLTWRRDRGQSTLEYVGLIVLVAAVVAGLVATGVSQDVAAKLGRQVCQVVGDGDCGDGDGTQAEAGGGHEAPTGGTGATGGMGGAGDTSSTGGTGGGTGGPGGTSGTTGGPGSTGTPGGPGSTSGAGTSDSRTNDGTTAPDGTTDPGDGTAPATPAQDTYPETHPEPEAAYDVQASATGDGSGEGAAAGDDGGAGEDCGGWGFFGCAWDRTAQVGKGLFVDGVWGDLTGIVALFDGDTWSGMADYGRQLGSEWAEEAKDAGDKWAEGDYLGALGDWGKASFDTVVTVGDDVFVGDEVRERWNNGEKTRAVTDVVWNVGSLFIPGYNVGKVVSKFGKLGRLGKVADGAAEAADKAGEAADRARRAADTGDAEAARRAAKEADEAADEAEEQARRAGCVIALGGPASRRLPVSGPALTGVPRPGGVAGSGTGVLAVQVPGRVVLASGGCDEEAQAAAQEARERARDAYLDRKRAEEPQRAKDAEKNLKQWPEPKRNDTSDPRNYLPPDWAGSLKAPKLGDADQGDGFWASRPRNAPPNWKNESWIRYQEQVTGMERNTEYVVPHPKEGVPDVEFDGWDSGRQTFLEAKHGYKEQIKADGQLNTSTKDKFLAEAQRQIDASGGRAIEWHFSDPDVAKAARRAFRDQNLPVRVVHTKPEKPAGDRNPDRFD